MRDQWIGKNVDLSELSKQVELFFIEKQFNTKLEKKPDGFTIEAVTEKILNVQLKIDVEISGQPNDFTVEYTDNKRKKGFFSSAVGKYLAWALGGGVIVLKEEKANEALEKFEGTFWSYVDEKIAQLTRP